ncbi:MAG: ABC transporter ATP-binding protein [Clostridia bacterium]|nr:ABC transporter ATP-binding protein [Clostridia bacterium]
MSPVAILLLVSGVIAVVFSLAYLLVKDKKASMGFERNLKDRDIIRRLLRYARPFVKQFILVLILLLLSVAYEIISPLILGRAEEMIAGGFEMKELLLVVALSAILLALSMLASYYQAVVLQRTGQRIITSIREDVFSHTLSLSHGQLNSIPVGKLVTRVSGDVGAISQLFTEIVVNLFKNIIIIVGVLAAMLILNWRLTAVVMMFTPFVVLFTVIFRKFARRAYRHVKNNNTELNTFLSENLSGMKIIQSFNCQKRKKNEFDGHNDRLYKSKREQLFVFAIFRPVVHMLYLGTVMTLFYMAAKGYINPTGFLGSTVTGAVVVSFYMYIFRFYTPIQNLAEQFNRLQSSLASAEKVFNLMDLKPDLTDDEGAIELTEVKGKIEFRDVWFCYKENEWVLKGVSFTVEAGETAAFVGATGAGKTTVLGLICRNYDIQKGEIIIDGVNIRRYTIASLRRHFGQMLQDVFLFSGTVRSNITLGEDDRFSEEEVAEACRYVNADKFIDRLKNGLDEEVRERGNNFSAGQRQLLSFARTVLHRPEIMILDEATANIDTETEVLIQDSLEKMKNIGTMLIVAHRLSTIRGADRIIVIKDGTVAEQGSHEALMEQKGIYWTLRHQSGM